MLRDMGLGGLEDLLLRKVMRPLAGVLYNRIGGRTLDFGYAYILGYSGKWRTLCVGSLFVGYI